MFSGVMSGLRRCAVLFSVICLLVAASVDAALAAGKRVAFVVGNGAYKAVPQLANPKNDATAVSEALRKVGFEVVTAIDLDRQSLDASIQKFIRSLAGSDLSVFYYSGHGVEVGGENRIIPVDAVLDTEASLEVETISLQTIMIEMRNNSRAQLLYLDACRDNPFAVKKFLVGADEIKTPVGRGLAKQKASIGSLIAYATEPGNIALDGEGANSPFTAAVLRHSFAENVDVQTALMQVTRDVWESTHEKQRPWSNATLVEPVFLNGVIVKPVTVDEPAKAETKSKTKVKSKAPEAAASTVAEPENVAPVEAAAPKQPAASDTPVVAEKPAAAAEIAASQKPAVEIAAKPVKVGLGAQQVLTEDEIKSLMDVVTLKLAKMPESGTLSAEGKPVPEGGVIDPKALAALTFEPSVSDQETKPEIHLEATTSSGDTMPVVLKQDVEVDPCDSAAGEPLDLQGTGKGVLPNEIDVQKALAACKLAVEQHPDVARFTYQLGRALLADKQTEAANKLFEKSAESGHVRALNQLGYMAQRGFGRPQSVEEANVYFKAGAEKGDPYAMLSYGRNLARGRGVKQDVAAGLEYLNRAVEMGHTYAMNELGGMYFYGNPVKANAKRGVRFYEASMVRGDIYGIRNMGDAYLNGTGVEKDPSTALALFKKAAKGGHPGAPTDIGAMYYSGNGVQQDLVEAITWYEQGAERGNQRAAANLAWIFSQGPQNHRDVTRAVQYAALAVALDIYGNDKDTPALLAGLPEKAKSAAVKKLIATVGVDNVETTGDLNKTIVLLSRKAWQVRNPRLDLF